MKSKPFLFVSVGSTDFDDLIHAVDILVPSLQIEGIMQIGHGKYEPINLPFFRFAHTLEPFYKKASFAIAHGGLATTMEILRKGIPLVSVNNPDRYDNHQEDLLEIMEKNNYLIWCRRLEEIGESLNLAMGSAFRIYKEPECNIHLHINKFLIK